jgi:hypothetical protein
MCHFKILSKENKVNLLSGPDSIPPSLSSSPENYPSLDPNNIESPSSCDSSVYSHNLTFPNNSMSYSRSKDSRKSKKDQICAP